MPGGFANAADHNAAARERDDLTLCRPCSSSSTSSLSYSGSTPISRTCSPRSGASAGHCRSTCSWPVNDWTRAGSGGWNRTCRTGSG